MTLTKKSSFSLFRKLMYCLPWMVLFAGILYYFQLDASIHKLTSQVNMAKKQLSGLTGAARKSDQISKGIGLLREKQHLIESFDDVHVHIEPVGDLFSACVLKRQYPDMVKINFGRSNKKNTYPCFSLGYRSATPEFIREMRKWLKENSLGPEIEPIDLNTVDPGLIKHEIRFTVHNSEAK